MKPPIPSPPPRFSPYQRIVIGMLAFLQFAVVLDFMLMAPLGALIMPALDISSTEFGLVVSAYAFSAGAAGLLTAGFADRYDRKKLLLCFHGGFVLGTLWCGMAGSFETLLMARVLTGLFAGVIGSVVVAIATDLFPPEKRGRVMGFIQTAFAASQVLGIPIGLHLSNRWNWHVPFLAMAALGLLGGVVLAWRMQPVAGHLDAPREHTPWRHLHQTLTDSRHLLAFATTALIATGGFMLMPFSSAYMVGNLGIDFHELPTVYLITGLCTIVFGPLIGRAADAFGNFRVFAAGTALSLVMALVFTHLGPVSLPTIIVVNAVMFMGVFSRIIPFQAMMSCIPSSTQRGAFNAISGSIQQLSGGMASVVAGHIVQLGPDGRLRHFDMVGYVVVGALMTALALLWRLQRSATLETGHDACALP